jgi:hypothetical protein
LSSAASDDGSWGAGQWAAAGLAAAGSALAIAATVSAYEQNRRDYQRVMRLIEQQRRDDANFGRFAGFDADGNPVMANTQESMQHLARSSGRVEPPQFRQSAPEVNVHLRNVNVLDQKVIGDYLAGPQAEKQVMNIMSRNGRGVRHIIQSA